jgi:transcriptional antiterminator NusG
MSEKSETKTTIFAVRTTIGRERTVQDLVFNRLRTINPVPDLKAIFTADLYRGFIFIEAIHQRDVVHITSGVPHVKGKVVGSIPFDAVEKVIKPEKVISNMEEGDIVEIIGGVFQNKKAQIIKMPKEGGKEEITVRLLDSDSALTVKLSSDFLKLYDKGKKVTTEYILTKETLINTPEEDNDIEIVPLTDDEMETGDKADLSYSSESEFQDSGPDTAEDNNESQAKLKKEKKGKKDAKSKEEKTDKSEAPTKVVISEEAVTTSMDEKFSFDDDLKDEEFEKEEEVPEKPAKKKKTAKLEDDEEEAGEDDDWAKFF